jgi:peptidoglycan-associated lipoprotein
MKSSKFTHLFVIGLALTCAVAGCKKKPVPLTVLPGQRVGSPRTSDPSSVPPIQLPDNVSTTGAGGGGGFAASGTDFSTWGHDSGTFASQTVYFDYDSAVVKSGDKDKVKAVAAYLQANPRNAVQIEGHCDERGTEEYNRALGERRALGVREELIMAGVSPERVETVSYGEDRPADAGHSADSWAKNRRGVFVLLTPP